MLPVGTNLASSVPLKSGALERALSELHQKQESGYVVLTVHGFAGMEEGAVLFRNGEITGCVFTFLRFDETAFGRDAAQLFMNAVLAEHGVFDVVQLSKQQAELVLAFNDKMAFEHPLSPKDLSKVSPKKYDITLVERYVGEKLRNEESRFDVLKKFGLKGL